MTLANNREGDYNKDKNVNGDEGNVNDIIIYM